MGSVVITRASDDTSYTVTLIQSITLGIGTNTFQIPVPEEEDAEIMTIGGVTKELTINWIIAEDDLTTFQSKINDVISFFITGGLAESYTIDIQDWDYTKSAVIISVTIQQKAAEPYKATVTLKAYLGSAI